MRRVASEKEVFILWLYLQPLALCQMGAIEGHPVSMAMERFLRSIMIMAMVRHWSALRQRESERIFFHEQSPAREKRPIQHVRRPLPLVLRKAGTRLLRSGNRGCQGQQAQGEEGTHGLRNGERKIRPIERASRCLWCWKRKAGRSGGADYFRGANQQNRWMPSIHLRPAGLDRQRERCHQTRVRISLYPPAQASPTLPPEVWHGLLWHQ